MKLLNIPRRKFVELMGMLGGGALLAGVGRSGNMPRPSAGQVYMGGFKAPKLDTVRLAFIGVGKRGSSHVKQFAFLENTEIVAICDLYKDLVNASVKECKAEGKGQRHRSIREYYGHPEAWKRMLSEVEADAVVISTPWELHAEMAIEAMKSGAHAFVEVPMAVTLQEHWDVVDTAESTQKHCMMMEQVNYGREELMFLNMCRQGVLGELLHGEASYVHDLRYQMEEVERGTGSWRTLHYAWRNGNLYPTHGLGPVAQYMSLARGQDNFSHLVSISTRSIGRTLHARSHYPSDHKWNRLEFNAGDMNNTIIKTAKGRTILVQWDETSPRPKDRLNLIQGTAGTLAGNPPRAAFDKGVEGETESAHEWATGEGLQRLYEKYDHPLYKRLGDLSLKMGGHGGKDFTMRYRIIECLREGIPLDQNVYEGCYWSVVAPLSEASVATRGEPQEFPDFTRGRWKHTSPLGIVS